eukprot:5863526-Pyramimonas_sp.AAC.1
MDQFAQIPPDARTLETVYVAIAVGLYKTLAVRYFLSRTLQSHTPVQPQPDGGLNKQAPDIGTPNAQPPHHQIAGVA